MAIEGCSSVSSLSSRTGLTRIVSLEGSLAAPLFFAALFCCAAFAAQAITVRFLSYADVERLPGVNAIEALQRVPPAERSAAWDAWVHQRASDVHDRILRGEEDSLAYLLVFGTSYTTAPRVTRDTPPPALQQAFDQRVTDCLHAIAAPGSNERLAWAAATLSRLGYRLDTPDGHTKAAEYMLRNLQRVLWESTELSQALRSAEGSGNREAELAQRARLFSRRGLAPDTSWPINFALSEAFHEFARASVIPPGHARRIAIIGPGLDFVDKDEGQDFYPPQSLQPFAVVDALRTSGLAVAGEPHVTTIDINSRVNSHLNRLAASASPSTFDLQLIRDRHIGWTTSASRYWSTFGSSIGAPVAPIAPPSSAGSLETRAVRVSADVLRRIQPIEANIIYQRVDLEPAEQFDLVIATNILLYYDSFEQMLAAYNIVRMLAPGGVFVTNTKLDDVPALPMTRVTSTATAFSSRPGDGEYIYVYGRKQ